MRLLLALIALALPLAACTKVEVDDSGAYIVADPNPAAPGFNAAGSDSQAIAIADTVMTRMGGRAAWDEARYFGWTFFNGRRHLWDKHANRARVQTEDYVVFLNLATKEGRVYDRASDTILTEVTGEAAREELRRAYSAWANDSYWLFMPFKLKDDGVTLTYEGERRAETTGRPARVLGLTFDAVGLTPNNRYEILVDDETGLVIEWAYFADAGDAEPGFRRPWTGYEDHGGLMLATDRGLRNGEPMEIRDVEVYESLPEAAFTNAGWMLKRSQ